MVWRKGGQLVAFLLRLLTVCSVLAGIAALTWFDFAVVHANSATAAFTYLLCILLLSTRLEFWEALAASFASMLAYNYYFLPPVGAFTVSDPQNWVALVTFLATAAVASQLSSSASRRAEEADARQQELQKMYDFSRGLILGHEDRSLTAEITHQIAVLFGIDNVWFYHCDTESTYRTDISQSPLNDPKMRDAAVTGKSWIDRRHNCAIVPIQLGGHALGSLGIAGGGTLSNFALEGVSQLIAIALERNKAQQATALLEATQENEQLKSTLLDAVAHEFKTPLTAIKAATSTALSSLKLESMVQELMTIVDEEADRMNGLVSDAIELARLGRSPVKLERELCSPEDLVSAAIASMRTFFEGRDMLVDVAPGLPMLNVDRKLTVMTVRQLLSNAYKYSSPGSPIQLTAVVHNGAVLFEIVNEGVGIAKSEEKRIFEKFYRSPSVRSLVAGTGLGLSISREIIEAQGGKIWVESAGPSSTRFSFTLPLA